MAAIQLKLYESRQNRDAVIDVNDPRLFLEGEIWKDISGFEGLYSISSYGRVKSLSRTSPRNCKMPEKIHRLDKHYFGYWVVDLYKNGKRVKFTVHRLVALNFLPNPENKREVNHIDSDPKNCRLENLEWVTPSENVKHSYRYGNSYMKVLNKRKGAELPNAKPVIQLANDGSFIKEWACIADAARSIKANASDICSVLAGKQKTCRGFKWKRPEVTKKIA